MEKNKGITLISLVITIIVLIILAGVAISMLSGDNGILRRATDASKKTDFAGKHSCKLFGMCDNRKKGTVPGKPERVGGCAWMQKNGGGKGRDDSAKRRASANCRCAGGGRNSGQYADAGAIGRRGGIL